MKRSIGKPLLFALSLCAAGCGGKTGTLTISLVIPATADPFASAAKVHMVIGDPSVSDQTYAVSGGHFTATVTFKPPSSGTVTGPVLIEALAGDGTVIARGETPDLGIAAVDESVSVWVAPVGAISVFPATLARARTDMAASLLPGLGIMWCGGDDAATASDGGTAGAVTDCDLLQEYTVSIAAVEPLPTTLPGAAAIPVLPSGATLGNVLMAGGGESTTLLEFDSTTGDDGTWDSIVTDPSLARNGAAYTVLTDGTILLAGGVGTAGPLATATIINTSTTVTATPTTPMTMARAAATATATKIASGDGALIVGSGTPEVYNLGTRAFTALSALPVNVSGGHTATALPQGGVLVLGGIDATVNPPVATKNAWLIDAVNNIATPVPVLSTARAFHTATIIGTTLLVCGGVDATGAALATCDLIDVSAAVPTLQSSTIHLGAPRSHHAATLLPQNIVVFAGGQNDTGLLDSVEVYTPK